jgi:urease accessory protein
VIRAARVRPTGTWKGEPVDVITLDHDERHRRRMAMTADGGLAFLLDLAKATALRDGDGLLLEDGGIVAVRARPEPLLEITTPNPRRMLRLAWHLGNRHLPVQIEVERLLIRPDHVIEEMVRNLGGGVRPVNEPFDPESGAYGGHGLAEDHGHDHGVHDHHGHGEHGPDHHDHDHDRHHGHAHPEHGDAPSGSHGHGDEHRHGAPEHGHDHHHPHQPRGGR